MGWSRDRWCKKASGRADRRGRVPSGEEDESGGGKVIAKCDRETPERAGAHGGYGAVVAEDAVDVIRKASAGARRAGRGVMSCRWPAVIGAAEAALAGGKDGCG